MKQIVVFCLVLVLVACTAKPADVNNALDSMQNQVQDREEARKKAMQMIMNPSRNSDNEAQNDDGQEVLRNDPGEYMEYYDGLVGNGRESVLFFHARSCPSCRANHIKLDSWYKNKVYSRSVYKLDYDTQTDLRAAFEVVAPDTFVLIDGNGNVLDQVTLPSEDQLEDILG